MWIIHNWRKNLVDNSKWKILLLAAVSLTVIAVILLFPQRQRVESLARNTYGGGVRTVTLFMQIKGEKEQELKVDVSPREYGEEEIRGLFRQACRNLESVVPGENKSLDHISQDLFLPSSLDGFPFTIAWEMDRYDVLGMDGTLYREVLTRVDPDNSGVLVSLSALFRLGEWEAVYQIPVRLFGEAEKKSSLVEQAKDLLISKDEESLEDSKFVLPSEIDGRPVVWSQRKENPLVSLAGISVLIPILLWIRKKQKKTEDEKERQRQMLSDYPEIVSEITMLLNAGMTVRNIWKRVAEDYQEQKKQTGRERAAYEEMVHTWKEMQSGIPENECYERFAARCKEMPYRKLGTLLAQNLRKGARGTADILAVEAVQALEDRKSRAKQLGEEAGTKLLVPMFLMLVVVLLMVVVPAFWSVQI